MAPLSFLCPCLASSGAEVSHRDSARSGFSRGLTSSRDLASGNSDVALRPPVARWITSVALTAGRAGRLQLANRVSGYNIAMNGVEVRSKLLFNNTHMLSVAEAIGAGDDVVDSTSLQDRLGLRQSAVQRILVALEGVGLMERLERQARTEPIRFQRTPHPFWLAAQELARA